MQISISWPPDDTYVKVCFCVLNNIPVSEIESFFFLLLKKSVYPLAMCCRFKIVYSIFDLTTDGYVKNSPFNFNARFGHGFC